MAALRAEVIALKEVVAAWEKQGGAPAQARGQAGEGASSSPPSAAATVEAALRAEADEASKRVKLQGFEGIDVSKHGAALCHQAGEVLGRMVGISSFVVTDAFWIMGKQEGHVPQLVVTTLTRPMATAVRALRAGLGGGKRIMGWWGSVEKAVRDVLFKEREAMLASDKHAAVRVVGTRLEVGGVERPLSAEAVTAGMHMLTKPKPMRGRAQGGRAHQRGQQQRAQA